MSAARAASRRNEQTMSVVPNQTKRRLAAGGIAIGLGLRLARTVDIATIAKACDYDWLFIDMEHGSLDVDRAGQIAVAALAVGVTPVVRVPGPEHYHATRLLDAGAQGIVVPHVDTAAQAARIVSYCRFPPAGRRSIGDADAIAAVKGVDVLLVGFNDLCAELGVPGELGGEKAAAAFASVVAACRKHGKHAGFGGAYDNALLDKYVAMGGRFVLGGGDAGFLMAAARERAGFLRSLKL